MDYTDNTKNNNLQNAALLTEEKPTTAILDEKVKTPSKHKRLQSLDIVRGFTIALMIFVDDVGAAYPHLNHSPWNNITLADFVMPWFLFMVGCSMAFSFRKFKVNYESKVQGTKYALTRAMKLYLLGVLIQGGDFFSEGSWSYGWNLATLRYCGILNRIGYAYGIVSLLELWLPLNTCFENIENPHIKLFIRNGWKWLGAFMFVLIYLLMTYLTFVPTWHSSYRWDKDGNTIFLNANETFLIDCDVRGSIDSPQCSAAGFYDRLIFTQQHLGNWMSQRLAICSSCSPGSCPRADAPSWCGAYMYDPEGFLATIPTVMSCWLGLHFGHVVKFAGTKSKIIPHWSAFGTFLVALGLIIHYTIMEMNKQLWTVSYVFFMAGTCGLSLVVVYCCVDVQHALQKYFSLFFSPLQYMGMNAILVFFWHGPAEALLGSVYITDGVNQLDPNLKRHTILTWVQNEAIGNIVDGGPSAPLTTMIYVLLKITCFLIATWYLYKIKYFWKV